ncbi:hypothetical protein NE237_033032 [Protea cynaroides]|uniref:Uncharacterized protein n=1 Tax=Protea cynaroides TaxID=273540 RepID=A0A9Q0R3N3_9MAGN|nr:hypothetical protein NE237_033032 [Protea cynaroides]
MHRQRKESDCDWGLQASLTLSTGVTVFVRASGAIVGGSLFESSNAREVAGSMFTATSGMAGQTSFSAILAGRSGFKNPLSHASYGAGSRPPALIFAASASLMARRLSKGFFPRCGDGEAIPSIVCRWRFEPGVNDEEEDVGVIGCCRSEAWLDLSKVAAGALVDHRMKQEIPLGFLAGSDLTEGGHVVVFSAGSSELQELTSVYLAVMVLAVLRGIGFARCQWLNGDLLL